MASYVFLVAALVADVLAMHMRIDVGPDGAAASTYSPNTTTAQVGDILGFHFVDENVVSSVVKGNMSAPILGDPIGVCLRCCLFILVC